MQILKTADITHVLLDYLTPVSVDFTGVIVSSAGATAESTVSVSVIKKLCHLLCWGKTKEAYKLAVQFNMHALATTLNNKGYVR